MNETVIDPIYWSAERIISYGNDTIHELALQAAGTLNSYHVVLGRCLLAVHRTKLYEAFGCSGAVHYGTRVLGLRAQKARTLRWVAQKLEDLPQLSRAGERGQIDWSKLREVIRKATPETEGFWLELCRAKTYKDIAHLVRCTPKGAIPGDMPTDGDKEPAVTDLRLQLGLTARTIVERGLQVYSLKQGRPVPLAEAVEALFARLLEKETSSASEIDALAKCQREARKDLLADEYRQQPLIQEARSLAQAMGLSDLDEECPEPEESKAKRYGPEAVLADAVPPVEDLASEMLREMESLLAQSTPQKSPARNNLPHDLPAHPIPELSEQAESDTKLWAEILETHKVACPHNDQVVLLANDWRNRRLRFNENARLPTAAQRRELLRRDGYCCSTPGCPNHLWLELHHVAFYCRKGKTISVNMITICGSCHANVHKGNLQITGQAPDKLVFRDRDGNDLNRCHDLGVAGWLDYWLGWRGQPEDSHQHRLAEDQLLELGATA